jgi:hypothetical protein
MAFMCLGTGNMVNEQTLPELHLLMLERFRTFGLLSIVTTTGGASQAVAPDAAPLASTGGPRVIGWTGEKRPSDWPA